MWLIELIGVAALAVLILLGSLYLRRVIIARRGGTIELSLRLSTIVPGRGWSPGLGRFVDDQLRWYRIFSFSVRPRRALSRRGLLVDNRRTPEGPERMALPADWVIMRCVNEGHPPIEIAMAESTLAGFLSWIEAAPPGAASIRLAAR